MAETERFISLVEKHPCLYGTQGTRSITVHRMEKDEAWREIAKEMGSMDGHYWKNKWRSLKDCYLKHLRSLTADATDTHNRYKNWGWATYLTFLNPHIKKKESTRMLARDSNPSIEYVETDIFDSQDDDHDEFDQPCVEEYKEDGKISHNVESSSMCKQFKAGLDKTEGNTSQPDMKHLIYDHDETDLYFLSYAKTFKRLPSKSQAIIKFEIAKLFHKYEMLEEEKNEERRGKRTISSESELECNKMMKIVVEDDDADTP